MKFAFIDPARAYAADAPWHGPLGGTQSAVCYLSAALVRAGHRASLYNHIATTTEAHGVTAQPWLNVFDSAADYDAIVLVGRWTRDMVRELKALNPRVYAWMHEAAFHPEWIAPDKNLSGIIYVSDWQKRVNDADLPPEVPRHVIKNAISPFVEARAQQPITKNANRVIFAGDTLRGLIPLVDLWPQIHAQDQNLTLEIYSDTQLQGVSPDIAAQFSAKLSALPGLAHAGKVGQAQLAEAMAGAAWHLSPNPYPETSCITLMEALALGCRSVTTARAALPETAHGFATLIDVQDADDHRNNHVPVDAAAFVEAFRTVREQTYDPASQQAHFLVHHTWDRQAQQWAALLGKA